MVEPQLTADEIIEHGYSNPKRLSDGRMAAVYPRIYNTIIISDIHRTGFEEQW